MKIWTVKELLETKFPSMSGVKKALKQYAATDLDARPSYGTDDECDVPGHLTKPVYWRGRQWAATAHGVECLDHHYAIEASRLWEDEKEYGWVKHMGGKGWVDLCDFAEALRIARGRLEAA